MKNLLIKATLVLSVIMFAQTDLQAQTGRYGNTPEDSIKCLRNLMLYGDRYRQKNYEDALPYWRIVFLEFPRASINTYLHGPDILSHMIQNAANESEKKAYLDTAMMMFNQRIEYFGDAANVSGRKGIFYFQHNNSIEEAGPGYEALAKAIELSGNNPSPAVVVTYMNVTVGKFRAGLIDNENVIEAYSTLMETLGNAQGDALQNAREMVEALFAESNAADCDALIRLFSDQVHDSPEDVELLTKVNALLNNTGCTDSDLYLRTAEKLHTLDPSPRSALSLSAMYRARDNENQVINYLEQAVDLQEDEIERANYYLELAIITNAALNNKQQSRQYALQALRDNPSLGRAHIHIGSLYAQESNCFAGEEGAEFKNRTVYWVAVDRFNEARRVDPTLTAEANRLIDTYSVYFPDGETIFFHGHAEGQSYTVGCWINETTRIRARR